MRLSPMRVFGTLGGYKSHQGEAFARLTMEQEAGLWGRQLYEDVESKGAAA